MYIYLLRTAFTGCILWGLWLCILSMLSVKQAESNELSRIDTIKRQPLNRTLLDQEIDAHLERGDISTELFNKADILHTRDKRNNTARFVSALDPVKIQNADDFLKTYLPLFSTAEWNSQVLYAKHLASLTVDNSVFNSLALELSKMPVRGSLILKEIMLADTREPDDLAPLIQLYPELQTPYLNHLIKTKRTPEAQTVFFKITGTSENEVNRPYNPKLLDIASPSPFNWYFNPKLTKMIPNGGVYVSFSEDRRSGVMYQIVNLAPGNHVLSAQMSGSATSDIIGGFQWSISCLSTNQQISTEKLDRLKPARETIKIPFSVPEENCTFQRLSLQALPGQFGKVYTTEVSEVTIIPDAQK